jgi:hypothetical protein
MRFFNSVALVHSDCLGQRRFTADAVKFSALYFCLVFLKHICNPRSKVQQPKQLNKVMETNPIPNCLNNQSDTKTSAKKKCPNSDKKWNLMMDTFLRRANEKLKADNMHVSFDNLKKGDMKKLCDTTAHLLMENRGYMKLSTHQKISGHSIQERLRCLSKRKEVMQVNKLLLFWMNFELQLAIYVRH